MTGDTAETVSHLRSNRGDHNVSFVVLFRDDATGIWLHDVVLTIENWARPGIGDDKRREAEVHLPQVALTQMGLRLLLRRVETWLANRDEFRVNIAGEDQVLEVEILLREDSIVSRDKPSCTVRYRWGASVSTECAFVVDESCMRILHQELSLALASGRN